MALIPKLAACFKDGCKTLRLTDTTGAYDATTNTGGWGAPNTTLAGADPVTVAITLPGSTTTSTFTVTSIVNAATIVAGEFYLDDIVPSDITGYSSDTFPDGIYDIVYTVTDGTTEYTYSIKMLNYCTVKCCLEKMKVKFRAAYGTCDWVHLWDEYQGALRLFDAMRYNMSVYDYTNTNKQLIALQKICKILNCNC
jgi:hypothetical protein